MPSFSTSTIVNSDTAKEIHSSEFIREFNVVASGTVSTVSGSQYPVGALINAPSKLYRNYVVLINNRTGQTISGISVFANQTIANFPVPNTPANTANFKLKDVNANPSIPTNSRGGVDLTSEEPNLFITGQGYLQFNMSASPTASGTIDWALIGY